MRVAVLTLISRKQCLSVSEQCDWALISYSNTSAVLQELVQPIAKKYKIKIAQLQDGNLPHKAAKVLFWTMFSPTYLNYDYIWLLDEGL
eukprot:15525-Heterococcus_DN1.PRE.2